MIPFSQMIDNRNHVILSNECDKRPKSYQILSFSYMTGFSDIFLDAVINTYAIKKHGTWKTCLTGMFVQRRWPSVSIGNFTITV